MKVYAGWKIFYIKQRGKKNSGCLKKYVYSAEIQKMFLNDVTV